MNNVTIPYALCIVKNSVYYASDMDSECNNVVIKASDHTL